MRELIVKPRGLVTRPNIYGVYPVGALATAQNLVMRAPGILESAPATVTALTLPGSGNTIEELLPLPSTKTISWSRTSGFSFSVRVDSTLAALPSGTFSSTNLFSSTGRIAALSFRDRVLMSSAQGHLALDPDDYASGSPTLRRVGLPQVCINFLGDVSGTVFTAANQACNYALVLRRKYSDGYELASVPSPVRRFISSGANRNAEINFWVSDIQAGDVIEIYRSARIDSAVDTTDPGSTLFLVQSFVYASGSTFSIVDKTSFGPLGVTTGKALYTNPAQEGATQSNRRPNIAQCSAVYKNYVFLGNITQRPRFTLKSLGGFQFYAAGGQTTGVYANARLNGIGSRQFTGTTVSGNPTITGISAAEIVGIVPGQSYDSGPFSGAARVLSVGVSSVTMTLNALSSGTTLHTVSDMLEINGSSYFLGISGASVASLTTAYDLEVTPAQTYGITEPSIAGGQELVVEPKAFDAYASFALRATNGANYDPPLPEIGSGSTANFSAVTLPNFINWSKESQPEHFPAPHEAAVGGGQIIAFESTRDALWIFCTDGLCRLSGAGGQWRVDTVDTTLVLSAPRASCVLRDVVYCYTNQGFGRVTDAGFEPLGDALVGDLLPGAEYTETASIILERNETEDEIVIRVDATQVYIYSVRENAYTTLLEPDVTCMSYVRYPVSGAACLAFGRSPSGSTPRYELWNHATNRLGVLAKFQPLYGNDPFTAKHWISGTFIFDSNSLGQLITPLWNGTPAPASNTLGNGVFVNECRKTFGVPRSAPAVGNSLAVGYAFGASTTRPGKLYAISLRYRQFGEEDLKRLANAG